MWGKNNLFLDASNVDTFIKPISEYGIMVVISAIFVGITVLVMRSLINKTKKDMEDQNKFFNDMMNQSLNQNQVMFKHILNSLDAGHKIEEEDENEGINLQVNSILSLIKDDSSCDHAAVFLYHNGGRDLTGRPFQNMSCTNEVISTKGISPFMTEMQRIPRGAITSIISGLKEKNFFGLNNIQDISKNDPSTFKFLNDYGTKSVYAKPIKDLAGNNIGFVLLSYVLFMPDDTIKQEEILNKYVPKLEGLMLSKNFNAEDIMNR